MKSVPTHPFFTQFLFHSVHLSNDLMGINVRSSGLMVGLIRCHAKSIPWIAPWNRKTSPTALTEVACSHHQSPMQVAKAWKAFVAVDWPLYGSGNFLCYGSCRISFCCKNLPKTFLILPAQSLTISESSTCLPTPSLPPSHRSFALHQCIVNFILHPFHAGIIGWLWSGAFDRRKKLTTNS